MTDARLDDGGQESGQHNIQNGNMQDSNWSWLPGAIFVLAVVGGLAFWAYSSGDLGRSALRSDPPATTGQGTLPPPQR